MEVRRCTESDFNYLAYESLFRYKQTNNFYLLCWEFQESGRNKGNDSLCRGIQYKTSRVLHVAKQFPLHTYSQGFFPILTNLNREELSKRQILGSSWLCHLVGCRSQRRESLGIKSCFARAYKSGFPKAQSRLEGERIWIKWKDEIVQDTCWGGSVKLNSDGTIITVVNTLRNGKKQRQGWEQKGTKVINLVRFGLKMSCKPP